MIENESKKQQDGLKPGESNLHRERDKEDHREEANRLNHEKEEFGGPTGKDPTRYGDWENGGRCTDF